MFRKFEVYRSFHLLTHFKRLLAPTASSTCNMSEHLAERINNLKNIKIYELARAVKNQPDHRSGGKHRISALQVIDTRSVNL